MDSTHHKQLVSMSKQKTVFFSAAKVSQVPPVHSSRKQTNAPTLNYSMGIKHATIFGHQTSYGKQGKGKAGCTNHPIHNRKHKINCFLVTLFVGGQSPTPRHAGSSCVQQKSAHNQSMCFGCTKHAGPAQQRAPRLAAQELHNTITHKHQLHEI